MDFEKSCQYITEHRHETIDTLCRFLSADTILFWSDDIELHKYQKEHWGSVLQRLNTVFKLDMQPTTELTLKNNKKAEEKFKRCLEELSDEELTACSLAAAEMKSVLLGLLLAKRKISADDACKAAFLEEIYQNEFWGEDVAAINARDKSKNNLKQIEKQIKKLWKSA